MDRYNVELRLDSETISGVAAGLEARDGQEVLIITTSAGDELIRVDRFRRMTVLTRPARFEVYEFDCTNASTE